MNLVLFLFLFVLNAQSSPLSIAHKGYQANFLEESGCTKEDLKKYGNLLIGNSVESASKAFEVGADLVEVDLRLTKDNKFVLFHDEEIGKLTNGVGKVKDYTLLEAMAKFLDIQLARDLKTRALYLGWIRAINIFPLSRQWRVVEKTFEFEVFHSLFCYQYLLSYGWTVERILKLFKTKEIKTYDHPLMTQFGFSKSRERYSQWYKRYFKKHGINVPIDNSKCEEVLLWPTLDPQEIVERRDLTYGVLDLMSYYYPETLA